MKLKNEKCGFLDCLIFKQLPAKNIIFETKPYHLSMKKFFLLLVILLSANGFACSCDVTPTVKQSFFYAEEVFTARVIRVDSSHFSGGRKIFLYDLEIIQFYKKNDTYYKRKNTNNKTRTFFARNSIGSCDVFFFPDREYLIYSSKSILGYTEIMNYADQCSRTTLLANVKKEELDLLEYLEMTGIKKDDPDIEYTYELPRQEEREYATVKPQIDKIQKIKDQNQLLKISVAIIFIISLIFISLYIKTKRKLKVLQNL